MFGYSKTIIGPSNKNENKSFFVLLKYQFLLTQIKIFIKLIHGTISTIQTWLYFLTSQH